jgi:cell division cycle 20-like protein 1 (cofactor of APC complex)
MLFLVCCSDDYVTSVSFTFRGTHLAVGTKSGDVQLWDVIHTRLVRTLKGHTSRVGALAWNHQSHHLLASGSRDRSIVLRDARVAGLTLAPDGTSSHATGGVTRWSAHRQEVCGLKWSFDGQQLASGGNDNKLLIWSAHAPQPVLRFGEHTAAVKAIAWSPHQAGLLVSGGGTADRCIRFWNTLSASSTHTSALAAANAYHTPANSGPPLQTIDTGSQVCTIMWSTTVNEIVSTHGYSLNQIICWKYPTMQKVAVAFTCSSLRLSLTCSLLVCVLCSWSL